MRKCTLLLLILIACPPWALAQKEQAREIARSLIAEKRIPGLSVSVIKDGKIIWSEGFGHADLEQDVKVTPETKFRIGSLSKLLTAATLARLHERGLIDLDASIHKYVPTFPRKKYDITVRQLAGHLGGIRHYAEGEFVNTRRYGSLGESLERFKDSPLINVPGTEYSYSTFGYTLLGAAIEGAAKKDYADCLQSEVLTPLNLRATVSDDNQKIIPKRTGFYSLGFDREWIHAPYTDNSDRAGLLSTTEDLVHFAEAHMTAGFLKQETLKMLFTPQKTTDGDPTLVGIAWRISKDSKGRTLYHHGGSSIGGRGFLVVYPEERLAIAVLLNLTFAQFDANDALAILRPFQEDSAEPDDESPPKSPSMDQKPEVNVTGVWKLTAKSGARTLEIELDLKQNDAAFTGAISTSLGNGKIVNGKVSGRRFVGDVNVEVQGQPMVLQLRGEIENGEMLGTIEGAGVPRMSFTGTQKE
ncbi:MAG: beta-lactamase family protein [Acidobacteriota bacterium]|nr:MAG: beta-lactamase family protein [Acidobacteriota bacterium]